MICASCHRDNDVRRSFCGRCGANLRPVCPGCNFVNDRDDRYCGGCGELLGSQPATAPPSPPPTMPPPLGSQEPGPPLPGLPRARSASTSSAPPVRPRGRDEALTVEQLRELLRAATAPDRS